MLQNKALLLLLGILLTTTSCYRSADAHYVLRQSPRVQEIQACRFPNKDISLMMREMVEMLETDGYMITAANEKLGVISAEKEVGTSSEVMSFIRAVMTRSPKLWNKRDTIKLGINFYAAPDSTRIRVIVQRRGYDRVGRLVECQTLKEPSVYHQFFVKFRKSLHQKNIYY